MKTIDFIVQDVQRTQRRSCFVVFYLLMAAGTIAIGLGARADFVDAFSFVNLGPAGLVVLCMLALPFFCWSPVAAKRFWMGTAIVCGLSVSLVQPQTVVSLAKFADAGRFWPENWHCLGLGILGGSAAALVGQLFCMRWLPILARSGRRIFSFMFGLSALSILSFHCMGAYTSHILIAHWGAGIIVGWAAYLMQSWIVERQLARVIGQRKSVRNLSKL